MCAEMMDVTRDEAKRILRRLGKLNLKFLVMDVCTVNCSWNLNLKGCQLGVPAIYCLVPSTTAFILSRGHLAMTQKWSGEKK